MSREVRVRSLCSIPVHRYYLCLFLLHATGAELRYNSDGDACPIIFSGTEWPDYPLMVLLHPNIRIFPSRMLRPKDQLVNLVVLGNVNTCLYSPNLHAEGKH